MTIQIVLYGETETLLGILEKKNTNNLKLFEFP